MSTRHTKGRGRGAGLLAMGALMGGSTLGIAALAGGAASAAPTGTSATFSLGILAVTGDAQDNTIVISRNAAGQILVDAGMVPITGGVPTVANTRSITVIGAAGTDQIAIDEGNGAMPSATLIGGTGNDTLTGGSSADLLVGQAGNDTLLGKGGTDLLFGGADNDALTGGTGDDQAFGEAGNDQMLWNPGDGTDLDEGGDGADVVSVQGGNGAEEFTATPNGSRVRFDRVTPAPFSLDIGTSESLVLSANGGDDSFTGSNGLAPLISTVVIGGTGNDTILGTDGADFLVGGEGTDFVDGQRGNDLAALGTGDDVFQWDPGDGSDTVEGQDGLDTMVFNGANIAENFDVSANGSRVRFARNVANITMDTNAVERIELRALGGADNVVVGDMTGTGVTEVITDLAALGGGDDASADTVTVNGTNAEDVAVAASEGSNVQVVGLSTTVSVTGATPISDRLAINTLAGDDVVDASGDFGGSASLVIDGGADDDVLIGGNGADVINGGAGDDVLIGGPGLDVLDGGTGDNVLIQGETARHGLVAGPEWLADHARVVDGETVLEWDGDTYTVPAADLA